MRCAPFALFAFVVASIFAKSTAPEVTFVSPCECIGFHGKNRWVAKIDLTPVPPDVDLTQYTEARMPSEQKWYALTGRVLGCVSAIESNGRTIFVADAHRGDGKRFVVHADEKLAAFRELESTISGRTADSMKNATSALLARRAQRR